MSLKFHRLNNRFLYFLSFQLPLTSSYSNRALVNYFNIFINMDTPKEKKKTFLKLMISNCQRVY